MKTIYNALLEHLKNDIESFVIDYHNKWIERLKEKGANDEQIEIAEEMKKKAVSEAYLRWFDWDKGQLKKKQDDRYPVAYPCALLRVGIGSTTDITDTAQDCKATVTLTLAFNPLEYGSTAAHAPDEIRAQGLEPYDVIAAIYKKLQGFSTDAFNPLRRRKQGELTHPDLFVYQIVFETEFEDNTAEE